MTKVDKMVGWHRLLNEYEFEQTTGDSEGQGSLECCSPLGCKESDMAEQLNNINITQEQQQKNKQTITQEESDGNDG